MVHIPCVMKAFLSAVAPKLPLCKGSATATRLHQVGNHNARDVTIHQPPGPFGGRYSGAVLLDVCMLSRTGREPLGPLDTGHWPLN